MGSLYFKFFTILGAASVVPVLAFPSNIHTQMNSEEIFETFGTNDLVGMYIIKNKNYNL